MIVEMDWIRVSEHEISLTEYTTETIEKRTSGNRWHPVGNRMQLSTNFKHTFLFCGTVHERQKATIWAAVLHANFSFVSFLTRHQYFIRSRGLSNLTSAIQNHQNLPTEEGNHFTICFLLNLISMYFSQVLFYCICMSWRPQKTKGKYKAVKG